MKNIITAGILILAGFINSSAQNKNQDKPFTESLMQDNCTFVSSGRNAYFILEPGYQLVLKGIEEKDTVVLVITVLNETKKIDNIETRVVEENESANGKTVEISRNYFAICKETNSVYYFGEEVDIYKNDKIVSHEGAWTAEGNNKSGVMVPGLVLLGARFYNEIAPGIAMDRAEIISTAENLNTPAGNFTNVLKIEETTPLEPKNKEYKIYAKDIGLIQDGILVLMKYGFAK